jgi:hemerythrin
MTLEWTSDMEIHIPVIDSQHRRIVEYINKAEHAHNFHSQEELLEVLDELVEYTQSHFTFEETLMEEAGYPFINAHKKVHALFIRRISAYHASARAGEDVTEELIHTLKAWLVNHIKHDDRDYANVVRANIEEAAHRVKARRGSWFNRLFG